MGLKMQQVMAQRVQQQTLINQQVQSQPTAPVAPQKTTDPNDVVSRLNNVLANMSTNPQISAAAA